MFYLGVYLEQEEGMAQAVVVEKSFYSGSRKYRVVHVERLEEPGEAALTQKLFAMRLEARWTAVKKVFSQSGRPPKTKREPPLILLSSWDEGLHMAEALRARCASVEMLVSREPGEDFRRRLKADLFHNCHVVSADGMADSMARVQATGRLEEEDEAVPPLPWEPGPLPAVASPWFLAMGSCFWHGESVKRVKRY